MSLAIIGDFMATLPKQDHAEVPVLVGRRSTRLSVAVPISINGTDASGHPFKEHTFTLSISKHGAEIASSHLLAPGSEITIENASAGRQCQARVIRRREKRSANSPYEVSIELQEPENIWGLRFAPTDWEKDARPKNGGTAAEQEPAPDSQSISSDSIAPQGTSNESASAARESAVKPAAESAENLSDPRGEANDPLQDQPAASSVVTETQPADEASAAEVEPQPQARPASESSETTVRAGAENHGDSSADAARMDEKIRTVRAFEQRVQALSDRLQTTLTQLEALLSKAGDARGELQSEIEKSRAEVQEAGRFAVGGLRESLRGEIEKASSTFSQETEKRLREEVSAAVAAFGSEARTNLARLREESAPELQSRRQQVLESATAAFSEKLKNFAEETSASIRSELEKSLEESTTEFANRLAQSLLDRVRSDLERQDGPIEAARLVMREDSADAAAKFREQCAQDAGRASGSIARELDEAAKSIQSTAEEANSGLWEASKTIKHDLTFKAEKLRKQLAEITSTSEAGFRNYTDVQVSGVREEIQEKVRSLVAKSAQAFSEEIQKTADAQLEASALQLHRQAEDALELSKGGLESATQKLLGETSSRLETVAREKAEALSSQTRAAEERFLSNLEATFRDFLTRSSSELERTLAKSGEEKKQAINREIEAECAKISARITAEIQSRSEAVAKDAADAVYKQVGVATVVLKDWGDQAVTRLEAQFKSSMEAFQKKVAELSTAARETDQRHAEKVTQEIQTRLEQAARILRGESGKTPGE